MANVSNLNLTSNYTMESLNLYFPTDSNTPIESKEELSHLEFWDKIGLMVIGTTTVCLTLLIVVCTVGPGCWINSCISMN